MAKLEDIFNIESKRREEIILRAQHINNNFYYAKRNYSTALFLFGSEGKLSMARKLYARDYKEYLNEEENILFNLYVIFPDDNDFRKLRIKYFDKQDYLAKIYNVTKMFLDLRYKMAMFNIRENNFIAKSLTLKNNSQN